VNKIRIRQIINVTVVAAIYVVLTIVLAPLAYGNIQFRLSELLMMLVCYNPIYSISLSVGCLIANFMSPMATIDIIFGTLATVIACGLMIPLRKHKAIASLIPAVVNGVIIGIELNYFFELPLVLSMFQVFLGEFVVVSLIGFPVMKLIEKDQYVSQALEFKYVEEAKYEKYLKPQLLFMFSIVVVSVVLFFKLPLYTLENDESTYSLFAYAIGDYGLGKHYLLFVVLAIPVVVFVLNLLSKSKASLYTQIALSVIGIGLVIYAIVISASAVDLSFGYYFIYFLSIIFATLMSTKVEDALQWHMRK